MNISSISAGIFSGKEGFVRQCIIIPEEEDPKEEDPKEHSDFTGQGKGQGRMLRG